jgi:hypothetical protein
LPDADRSWGINWLLNGRPSYKLSYLGPLLQEAAFGLFDDQCGVRAAALAGAVLASLAMFGWLLARRVLPAVALFGALLFLIDPMISQSYRGARVDSLAMGFMFIAFWAVHTGDKIQGGWYIRKDQVIAGACVGAAGLVWSSAALLLPLLIYELFARASTSTSGLLNIFRNVLPSILYIGLFCVLTISAFLMLAFGGELFTVIADFLQRLFKYTGRVQQSEGVEFWQGLANVLLIFKYNPWLPAVAVILIALDRRLGLSIALLIALVAAIFTTIYIHRVIYLIPYLILATVLATSKFVSIGADRRAQLYARIVVLFMLMTSAAVTLGARTWTALYEREARDPVLIERMGESLIGKGEYRVYVRSWCFYYVGRRLGWRMYRSLDGGPPTLSTDWMKLVSKMDYLIFPASSVSSALDQSLKEAGFEAKVVNAADYLAGSIDGRRRAWGGYIEDYAIYQKKPVSRVRQAR